MKEIYTNKGEAIQVDDEDFEKLSKYTWHLNSDGYAVTTITIAPRIKQATLMHRLILGVTSSEVFVDHRNEIRRDNQRENLRQCSHGQNLRNRGKNKNNTSGYKGVFFCKRTKRWLAQIRIDSKAIYLGRHNTPELAAAAYNIGALKHHGEFAKLNTL